MRATRRARFIQQGSDIRRIEGLSDGLFATVLTLLVLELRVPELVSGVQSDSQLLQHLVDLWPRLFSYLLTFMVAGGCWVAHHRDFSQIARYDRRLLWLNLMFLLTIGILPFSTELLGANTTRLSWTVYAINIIFIGLMMTAIWGYAVSHNLTKAELGPALARYALLRHLVTPFTFLLSIVIAPFSLQLAYLSPLLSPVFQNLLELVVLGRHPPQSRGNRAARISSLLWRSVIFLPLIAFLLWTLWINIFYHK